VSVARDTTGFGHPGEAHAVESGVIHQHHLHEKKSLTPDRPARCLRHGVWMAVCDDCRAARADLVSGERKATAAR
jgi:hypothetical protein